MNDHKPTPPECLPKYLPTPEEIVTECAAIRESWSPQERYWRARGCDARGRSITPKGLAAPRAKAA